MIDSLRVFSFLADHPPQCPPHRDAIDMGEQTICAVVFLVTLLSVAPEQTFKSDITYIAAKTKSAHDVRPARRAASSVLPLPRPALAAAMSRVSPCSESPEIFPDFSGRLFRPCNLSATASAIATRSETKKPQGGGFVTSAFQTRKGVVSDSRFFLDT